ncbi:hypothetical protein AMJ85_06635 [candidate division BRC1 bacterium SM23_51]|nr:MAG: hypothetical protein AMJ85_06635 [candidate division BRC1 bacterium SM23_51]
MIAWAIVTAVAAAVSLPAGAEVITRKDGRKIEGQIVRENTTYLMVKTTYGTFRIPKDQIASIAGRRAISQNEREGREALAAGDLDRALVKFQAALKETTAPEDRKALQAQVAQVNERIQAREEKQFESQLATADGLIQEKRFADALVELESLLRRNPEPSAAARMIRKRIGLLHMAEASYYEDQINYAEAVDAYQKAIELMPDAAEPYLKMARLVQRRGGRQTDVIDYYVKGIEISLQTQKEADLLDEYYELGKIYLKAGSSKEPNQKYLMEGLKCLLIVLRRGGNRYPFAANQLENGFTQLSKVDYDKSTMIKMLQSTLEINPGAQKVRWLLAEVYSKTGQYDRMIENLRKIETDAKASGEPLPEELYYRLGLAYLATAKPDYDAALEAFENEILANKLNYMALVKAAQLHSRNGIYEEALAYCNKAIGLRKERPEAYWIAGDTLVRRRLPGDTVKAQKYLENALELKSDFYQARIKLAEIEIMRQREMELPDYQNAVSELLKVYMGIEEMDEKALTDEHHNAKAEAILWLAEIENDKKNPRAAASMVEQALVERPNFPRAYRVQGQIQAVLESFDEAKQSYLKAIELDPRTAETYMLLGILCQNSLESYDEAIKYYQAYIDHRGTEVDRVTRWIGECTRAAAAEEKAEEKTEKETFAPSSAPEQPADDTASTPSVSTETP